MGNDQYVAHDWSYLTLSLMRLATVVVVTATTPTATLALLHRVVAVEVPVTG